jgi:hypothetical protein
MGPYKNMPVRATESPETFTKQAILLALASLGLVLIAIFWP